MQIEVILNDSYNDELKETDVCVKNPDKIRLLHFIQSEKPYFDGDKIKAKGLENVIFIKTKQDNPNIIK